MSAPPISFSFSKKSQPKKLGDSKLRDDSTKGDNEEKDFVKCVVGNEIQGSLKKEKPKEWIIPLIKQNQWRLKDENTTSSSPAKETTNKTEAKSAKKEPEILTAEESLERQAIRELISEANGSADPGVPEYEVPLLLQNKIPGGYENDDNMDVSLRPEQSTLEDYDNFPVEHFGVAMLKGMGWTEKEGIGRTNKGVVELKEPTLRPKGLGLGAERPNTNKDATPSKGRNEEETKLSLKIGAFALINRGSNKGMYGQVESFDEDNNRVILKLALTSKMAAVSKFYIDVVSPSEFKAKSKILNNEKFEKYKQMHEERDLEIKEGKRRERDDESLDLNSSSRHRSRRDTEENGDSKRHRKDFDQSTDRGRDKDHRERERSRDRDRDRSRHTKKENSSKRKHSKKEKKNKKKKKHRRDTSTSSASSSNSSDDHKSSHKRKR